MKSEKKMTIMHKVVMGAVSVFCVVTIIGVHLQQTQERVEMHKGVLNDKERIRMKAAAAKEKKIADKAARLALNDEISSGVQNVPTKQN